MIYLNKKSAFVFLLFLLAPFAVAFEDNYFSVLETGEQYTALPGSVVYLDFVLSNRGLLCPRNVTVYIDPCPVGFVCDEGLFCFNESGRYPLNLSMKISEFASPKTYTVYIRLDSYYDTRRGNDRIAVKVISPEQADVLSYEEYLAKQAGSGMAAQKDDAPVQSEEDAGQDDEKEESADQIIDDNTKVAGTVEEHKERIGDVISNLNNLSIVKNVENLESSRQFVEYLSVVLVVILVFTAAGAYASFRKGRRKNKK